MKKTIPVHVGQATIGGGRRPVLQSMCNLDTMDIAGCVAQVMRIHAAGGHIVRLTTPSIREAEALGEIVRRVREQPGGAGVGIVADVHFSPEVALAAADHADKVRINPGNYRAGEGEFERLIEKCRARGVAIRIGVNHGSLSDTIVRRYGDTPAGMVASAMEFLEVCRAREFDQVVVSMKSSNVRVMVHAYRLLARRMRQRGMRYPLHLGVTEAGDGMQGRVKSAVGIGTLLGEGLGDTIRVSLSEAPENEIPVARLLADHFAGRPIVAPGPTQYARRLKDAPTPLLRSEVDSTDDFAVLEGDWRAQIAALDTAGDTRPVMLHRRYAEVDQQALVVKAAADFGPLLADGLADGIWIENPGTPQELLDELAYQILQASRMRITRTEYIACPGCGRTLYDLQGTLARIRERTAHLIGLKIGVMGCIVNGPGEMADADWGYVGSGKGKVTLYKGREVVRRGVPEAEAVDALLALIEAAN